MSTDPGRLHATIAQAIEAAGGWLPFDRYMALALYAPGLGYYARASQPFGRWPGASDFVTAPELTPLFGQALARQLAQALAASETDTVIEFGAGSGALAETLLDALAPPMLRHYDIVELSGALRSHQAARLARFGDRVRWLERLPAAIAAVAIGNEVLDAMPVQLLAFDGARWHERGVVLDADALAWRDRPSALRPPHDAAFAPGSVTELHAQAHAFIATLGEAMQRGAAFFVDYGFPAAEYYHPQRSGGTLMCHRAHRSDDEPLRDVGRKDITAHVDFTGIALAAEAAGFDVIGYTSQARFLLNCGLAEAMQRAEPAARADAHPLIAEHEMGELFKVIGLAKGCRFDALGFAQGDRTHRL
ncbi:MAG: hypothetical protein LKCHEGNO_03023 [Burkholderiaceae bacterium]|nr:hypothetical protein [Burkholderiaceae bacterium]